MPLLKLTARFIKMLALLTESKAIRLSDTLLMDNLINTQADVLNRPLWNFWAARQPKWEIVQNRKNY